MASPPAALISETTLSASSAPLPPPWRSLPRSLTTTFAPSLAKSSACSRPMPPPEPVMIATFPSSRPMCAPGRRRRRLLAQGSGLANGTFERGAGGRQVLPEARDLGLARGELLLRVGELHHE